MNPAQKTALALRIAHARFLDPFAAPPEEPVEALEVPRAIICLWVAKARQIESQEAGRETLRQAAADLEAWDGEPSTRVREAASNLYHIAEGFEAGDGNGSARPQPGEPRPCRAGFLAAVEIVEQHALSSYTAATACKQWPNMHYETRLTPDKTRQLGDLNVDGQADISGDRRVVLVVKDVALSPGDLCLVVYALFHEIICHGLQNAATQPWNAENCTPQCHWSEGWMDAVAFQMAVAAANERGVAAGWLPLSGADAADAMNALHRARYKDPRGLSDDDARTRRAARKAMGLLQVVLIDNGLANSPEDAEEVARQFSLLANATADWNRLAELSELLQGILLSQRSLAQLRAAEFCIRFLSDRDFGKLLLALSGL